MEIGGWLSGLGVNCHWTVKKDIRNETVILTEGSVANFTDEQLISLFQYNYVIADGSAVLALQKRKLGRLVCCKNATLCPADCNLQAYEQAEDDFIVEGKKHYRASSLAKAGDYVKIEYKTHIRSASKIAGALLGN